MKVGRSFQQFGLQATALGIRHSLVNQPVEVPSVLAQPEVNWSAADADHLHAEFTANDEEVVLDYATDDAGELNSVSMPRWGNPGGGPFRAVPFGALAEESGTFRGLRFRRGCG